MNFVIVLIIVKFILIHKSISTTLSINESGVANETLAVEGDVGKLSCDTSPPSMTDYVHLVIWYKHGRSLPIYSYDIREKSVKDGKHWSDELILGKRASFRLTNGKGFSYLFIKNITESDGGLYRCRVDFKKSPTRNYNVNLTIILLPHKVNIFDGESTQIVRGIAGPYYEGSNVNLTCVAVGGRPSPNVTWWREHALIDYGFERISMDIVRNTLHITNITRQHLLLAYTCQVTNNNLAPPLYKSVSIDVILPPLAVKLEGDNKPLSAGRLYEFGCQITGARPSPIVTWWKGSSKLKDVEKSDYNDGNITVSKLRFIPNIDDDGQMITCKTESSIGSPTYLQDTWKLTVYHAPFASLELGKNINSSGIKEGVDVYFECSIKSNPSHYKVIWKHNGKMIQQNINTGILFSNQSLILQKVTRTQGGLYTCGASNLEGDGESNPFYLDVKYSPMCLKSVEEDKGAGRGEVVRVTCEVEANPRDVEFIWKFDGTSGSTVLGSEYYTVEETKSVAVFTPVTELDYGMLLCWAKNRIGMQKSPCIHRIFPAGVPESLTNCTLTNQTTTSFIIKCFSGFDGGLSQKFILELYGSMDLIVTNVTSNQPDFLITKLQPGKLYKAVMYPFNDKGRGAITEFNILTSVDTTENEAVRTLMLFKLPPIIFIFLGFTLSLILLACFIIFGIKHRTKLIKDQTSYVSKESLENSPDIIPDNDDFNYRISSNGNKVYDNNDTEISLISHNSLTSKTDIPKFSDDGSLYKSNRKKCSVKFRKGDVTYYKSCDQPCPPNITSESPLLIKGRIPCTVSKVNRMGIGTSCNHKENIKMDTSF